MLKLAQNGVPMEVSAKWSRARRLGAVVALGEMEGGSFSWRAMEWRQQSRTS